MKWFEYLSSLLNNKDILICSISTTGLKVPEDKLLAVSYAKIGISVENDVTEYTLVKDTIYNKVSYDVAQKGYEYHGICKELILDNGKEEKEFINDINILFKSNICMTYNPKFVSKFLNNLNVDANIEDILMLNTFIESRIGLEDTYILNIRDLFNYIRSRTLIIPSFKKYLDVHKTQNNEYTGIIPAQKNIDDITAITIDTWDQLNCVYTTRSVVDGPFAA